MRPAVSAFPVRRVCGLGKGARHTCERAIVLCGGCMQRVCAHFARCSVRVDIETGERISPMDERASAIVVGTCWACSSGRTGWDMDTVIAAVREAQS